MDKRELIAQNISQFRIFYGRRRDKRQSRKYFKAEERNNKSRLHQQIDFGRK